MHVPAIILAIAAVEGSMEDDAAAAASFRFDMCEFMDERMSFLPMAAVRVRLRLGELWLSAVVERMGDGAARAVACRGPSDEKGSCA